MKGSVGIPAFEPLVTTCDPHYGIGFGGNGHLTRLSKPEHGHDTSCCHYVDKMQCVCTICRSVHHDEQERLLLGQSTFSAPVAWMSCQSHLAVKYYEGTSCMKNKEDLARMFGYPVVGHHSYPGDTHDRLRGVAVCSLKKRGHMGSS